MPSAITLLKNKQIPFEHMFFNKQILVRNVSEMKIFLEGFEKH